MSDQLKPLKVKFAPGVLESLEQEMSADDLQKFLDQIKQEVASGNMFTESRSVNMTELMMEDPELYGKLKEQLEAVQEQPTETLQ